ncbi:MAG: nitrate reductase molybdenum cofactor assembly chaperone [Acidobacteria bacterium]|nr:nitrate reductase molybdenum cofactor assembly chaperone [Acidobacteriota bacterium]
MNQLYENLADLLDYPSNDWSAVVEDCKQRMNDEKPEIAGLLLAFFKDIEGLPIAVLQERYTQTFDLNPVCNLEIGYHLFGENYKRGIFLANLRETETPFALGQESQLPDYLPVLLRLLVKLEDAELRGDLISECLLPALNVMTAALQKAENFYGNLLAAVHAALKEEAPPCSANLAEAAWRRAFALPVLQANPF